MYSDENIVESFVDALDYQGEMAFDEMMGFVLAKARRFTSAEAGSIFIKEPLIGRQDNAGLRCVSVQNDLVSIPTKDFTIPINPKSIAGYVALNGAFLNVDDLYRLDGKALYSFNPSFDKKHNYKSRSMLAFPCRNIRGQVLGVIQLLNHIDGFEGEHPTYTPFGLKSLEAVKKLSLILGMVIERAALMQEIDRLGGTAPETVKVSTY